MAVIIFVLIPLEGLLFVQLALVIFTFKSNGGIKYDLVAGMGGGGGGYLPARTLSRIGTRAPPQI